MLETQCMVMNTALSTADVAFTRWVWASVLQTNTVHIHTNRTKWGSLCSAVMTQVLCIHIELNIDTDDWLCWFRFVKNTEAYSSPDCRRQGARRGLWWTSLHGESSAGLESVCHPSFHTPLSTGRSADEPRQSQSYLCRWLGGQSQKSWSAESGGCSSALKRHRISMLLNILQMETIIFLKQAEKNLVCYSSIPFYFSMIHFDIFSLYFYLFVILYLILSVVLILLSYILVILMFIFYYSLE